MSCVVEQTHTLFACEQTGLPICPGFVCCSDLNLIFIVFSPSPQRVRVITVEPWNILSVHSFSHSSAICLVIMNWLVV